MQRLNRRQNYNFKFNTDLFYVNLVIVHKPSRLEDNYVTRGPAVQSTGEHVQLKDIFAKKGCQETATEPKIVVISGPAGIGKSTVTQKLVHLWAEDQLWSDKYDYVFHLRCRELLEEYQGKEISMADLIKSCIDYDNRGIDMLELIEEGRDKVLFIIDGLDELSTWCDAALTADFHHFNKLDHSSEIHNVINNLIHGRILVGIYIIITSRPISLLDHIHGDRYISILGFDEKAVTGCLSSICNGNEKMYEEIVSHLKNNTHVFNLCVIPLFCVLFGVISSSCVSSGQPIHITSMTHMLIYATRHLLMRRTGDTTMYLRAIKQPYIDHIINVAKLAAENTISGTLKLIFTTPDIERAKIDKRTIESSGLLEYFREESVMEVSPKTNYSFLHFMFQEFLAAVYVCITWQPDDVILVSQADSDTQNLHNVQMFMAGLLGDSDMGHSFLNDIKPNQPSSERACDFLKVTRQTTNRMKKLQLILCVHEGRMSNMMDAVKNSVLSDNGTKLDLNNTPGGLLPHHMASVGWFIQEAQCVHSLR